MIVEAIYLWARAFPDRTALIHNDVAISYAAFARAIDACRRYLASRGLPRGHTAIVATDDLREAWFLVLGLRAYGCDTIHIQAAALAAALDLRNPGCIVTGEVGAKRAQAASDVTLPIVTVPAATFAGIDSGDLPPDLPAGSVFGGHILHTSGSTGARKKLLVRAAIEDRANADRARIQSYGPGTVHNGLDFGLWTGAGYRPALAVWHTGGTIVLDQRPDNVFRLFDHGVDRFAGMPETLKDILAVAAPDRTPTAGAKLSVGGGVLPLAVAQDALRRLTDHLVINYSATEFYAAPASVRFCAPEDLHWLVPAESRTIRVVDEHGHECPLGQPGIVCVRMCEFDVQSYFEDEETTARTFRDGFCRPGDLGVMRADGRLRLLGREGDVINVGGQKIPAAQIEVDIQRALRVQEVCVFAGSFGDGAQELVIAVKTDRELPAYELADLAREFDSFDRVRVAILAEFPRTTTGTRKTLRPELRALAFASARQIDR